MRFLPGFVFSAAAMLMTGAAIVPAGPARAAVSVNINFGFNTFHDRLSDRGRWIRSPIWGDVWQPRRRLVGDNFQPYSNGYWEYTDEYGWYWVSNDPFDDVVYHYGRWVYDPDQHWLWIPGYTWSPGWVVWREGGGYSGWLPMPPDENFVSGNGLSLGMNFGSWGVNFYGYNRWYGNRVDPDRFWTFVDNRNLANRNYRHFVVPRERAKVLITNTRNVTKFEVVNNRVVNRSIDVKVIERASGRRIMPVPAKQVIKANAIVTTVDESNRIRQRERAQHPISTDAFKGQAGGANDNRPGNGNGRPGAVTGGTQQPNATPEGGKRDRDNNGPGNAANGPGGAPQGGANSGQSSTPKTDKDARTPRDRSNGNAAPGMEKPGRPPRGNATTGGVMTGPAGNASPSSSTTPPDDNTSPSGAEKPKRTPRNPGGAMMGPSPSQPTATAPGDNAAPPGAPPSERATRGPRSITPPGGATTAPSGNIQPQPPMSQRTRPNPNAPGSATPPPSGASNPPSPDNSGNEPKKKKHNPPGTTPDSSTPQ
jgi:hypothetical protein